MADTLFIIPFQALLWNLLLAMSGFLWSVDQAGFQSSALMMSINQWLMESLFGPALEEMSGLMGWNGSGFAPGMFSLSFTIAVFLAGISYVLAPYAKIRVVDPIKAVGWLLFALFFFNYGPAFYVSAEEARHDIAAEFFEMVVTEAKTGSAGIPIYGAIPANPNDGMLPVTNNFAGYVDGDDYIDGTDIAMAYIYAISTDVFGYPDIVPVQFRDEYYPDSTSPMFFMTMSAEQRIDSIVQAATGIWRLNVVWLLLALGLLEQAINLCLTISAGILFISMSIALLFAFFERTEIMARSIIDMWIEMFIFTLIVAVVQAFAVGIAWSAAEAGKPGLTLATGFVSVVILFLMLLKAISTVMDATNRFFGAAGQVIGGKLATPGDALVGAAGAAGAAALTIATGGLGAAAALGAGASGLQVLGSALHGSDMLYNASALGQMVLPDDSKLKKPAQQFYEGALSNRMLGPAGGFMLRNRKDDEATAGAPGADDNPSTPSGGNGRGPSAPAPERPPSTLDATGDSHPPAPIKANGNGASGTTGAPVSAAPGETDVRLDPGDISQIADAVRTGTTQALSSAEGLRSAAGERLNHPAMPDRDIEQVLRRAINGTRAEVAERGWMSDQGLTRSFEKHVAQEVAALSPQQREAVDAYRSDPRFRGNISQALQQGMEVVPEFNDDGPMRYEYRVKAGFQPQLHFGEGLQISEATQTASAGSTQIPYGPPPAPAQQAAYQAATPPAQIQMREAPPPAYHEDYEGLPDYNPGDWDKYSKTPPRPGAGSATKP